MGNCLSRCKRPDEQENYGYCGGRRGSRSYGKKKITKSYIKIYEVKEVSKEPGKVAVSSGEKLKVATKDPLITTGDVLEKARDSILRAEKALVKIDVSIEKAKRATTTINVVEKQIAPQEPKAAETSILKVLAKTYVPLETTTIALVKARESIARAEKGLARIDVSIKKAKHSIAVYDVETQSTPQEPKVSEILTLEVLANTNDPLTTAGHAILKAREAIDRAEKAIVEINKSIEKAKHSIETFTVNGEKERKLEPPNDKNANNQQEVDVTTATVIENMLECDVIVKKENVIKEEILQNLASDYVECLVPNPNPEEILQNLAPDYVECLVPNPNPEEILQNLAPDYVECLVPKPNPEEILQNLAPDYMECLVPNPNPEEILQNSAPDYVECLVPKGNPSQSNAKFEKDAGKEITESFKESLKEISNTPIVEKASSSPSLELYNEEWMYKCIILSSSEETLHHKCNCKLHCQKEITWVKDIYNSESSCSSSEETLHYKCNCKVHCHSCSSSEETLHHKCNCKFPGCRKNCKKKP